MRRAVAFVVALSFVGCPLLKSKKSDDDGTGTGTVTTVSGTGAKNEKDVLRYKEEIPMGDLPAVIGKDNVQPKAYPQLGQTVATLPKGTAVTQKAKYFSTGVLVSFADPTTPGATLLGWVTPEDLATGAPTAATTAAPATTPKPNVVAIVTKDAGVAVVDAGTAPTTSATSAVAAGALFTQAGPDGKCPAGFVANGGGCRRPCATDANCPPKTFCKAKFCSSTK